MVLAHGREKLRNMLQITGKVYLADMQSEQETNGYFKKTSISTVSKGNESN